MSGETPSDIYNVIAKSEPVAAGHYFGWRCAICKHRIPVTDDPSGGKTKAAKLAVNIHAHARLKCPKCSAERLYPYNDLEAIHVRP